MAIRSRKAPEALVGYFELDELQALFEAVDSSRPDGFRDLVLLRCLRPLCLPVELRGQERRVLSVCAQNPEDERRFIDGLLSQRAGSLVFPVAALPPVTLVSRFLAKAALEILAFRLLSAPGGVDEAVAKPELDELRTYARRGGSLLNWPYHERRLYDERHVFIDGDTAYEVLHEFDLLVTAGSEFYAVIAILGVEYAINLGGPSLDGYVAWLEGNAYRSKLYP